ncbi:hypothetical protein BGW38_003899 [Lunasporangiospora selenospora]|uniref:Uncharacterized protein n=1 Tax=Lunasporangiospora selenospora TaxID=979761 RepID=A0A9P6KGV8_9FUNG|nr:hypothetical protein BGW38_003899 [Lunasporangiospora selenospora]
MDVNSTHLLGFLQGLEGRHSKDEGYTSQEGTNSELLGVSLQVEPSSHQYQQVTQGHQTQEDQEQTRPRGGSDLESVRVWFTHSILDEAIVKELSDRERHPRLQEVEFGSEDVFDVGEILVARLAEVRPELKFCCWVSHGDEGNERED